jgi:hypothetical protein
LNTQNNSLEPFERHYLVKILYNIEKKELLRDSLIKITKAKWASQKLRHRAMKEIAKLDKRN